jgi:TctA family transporter
MLFSPVIVDFALDLGPQEYFSLMVMGLLAASVISVGSPIKGIAMVVVGILLGLVGIDISTGAQRFTFSIPELTEGFSIVVVALGLFGIAEIVVSIKDGDRGAINKGVTFRSMLPTKDDLSRAWKPMLRGTGVGAFVGALPGAGSTIASFMAYAVERKISKNPERFGNGAIEGLAAPEAANNAGDQTAFIPTLTLGIPGSATMALMLNVLLIHGVAPGPMMVVNHADIFWGLVMSFWIGNVLLVILNLPMVGVWVRVLSIPYSVLFPSIMMFVCIGAYTINYSAFDVGLVAAFGVLGYGMRLLNFPAAPLLLGFVLGPMMEEYFRRAMVLSRGDFMTFFDRPLSLSFLLVAGALLLWAAWGSYRNRAVGQSHA